MLTLTSWLSCLHLSSAVISEYATIPSLHGIEEWNPGVCAYEASSLPSEPVFQPDVYNHIGTVASIKRRIYKGLWEDIPACSVLGSGFLVKCPAVHFLLMWTWTVSSVKKIKIKKITTTSFTWACCENWVSSCQTPLKSPWVQWTWKCWLLGMLLVVKHWVGGYRNHVVWSLRVGFCKSIQPPGNFISRLGKRTHLIPHIQIL